MSNAALSLTSPRFKGNAILRTVICGNRVLEDGDYNAAVELVQKALLALGYNLPKYGADSDFGGETETAVRAFQREQRIGVTGKIDATTLKHIDAADASLFPQSLLADVPSDNMSRAAWILQAHERGFVLFKFNCEKDLSKLAQGKKVGDADPSSATPIRAVQVMYDLVKGLIQRWVVAGEPLPKPTITLGSFITSISGKPRPRAHGKGDAIDINHLDFDTTAKHVIALLGDLPRGTYGIGLPFQGPFFPEDRELAALKKASLTGRVSKALLMHRAHIWKSTRDPEFNKWADEKELPGGAYMLCKSKKLKEFLTERMNAGRKFVIFPDYEWHLHIDCRA